MKYFFAILFALTVSIVQAQTPDRCGMTVEAHEQMMEENEQYRIHHENWRKKIEKILSSQGKNPSCANGPIQIPVAIHFDSGIVPAAQEACAITVVEDQINEMNNEIAGLDSDAGLINNFLSCFGTGILGDACIEFCIGKYNHPASSGLVDGQFAVTFGTVSFSIPSGNYTPVNADWNEYINIYVDDLPAGLLGVSNGIPGLFNGDGVLVDNCVFGTGNISCSGVQFTGASGCYTTYDEGETLAHELGHYLGLYHIWGDNFHCSGTQDMVADTPDMATNYSGYLSCGSHTSCTDLPSTCSSEDMYMNFMSYAGDACMYMFTSDQSDVMNATAVSEGFTTASAKCSPPPIADFTPATDQSLCNTTCIDFTDTSLNTPTVWEWDFKVLNGNLALDISSSTLQNPTVCVISGDLGSVEVELTAGNAGGTDSEVKSMVISFAPNQTYYADTDSDSYGDINSTVMDCQTPAGYVSDNTDCDDSNSNAYPGNTEVCDGVDNNCDGNIDEGCSIEDCDGDYLTINTITQDSNRAQFTILSDAQVTSGQPVLFSAGSYIDLDDGFEVVAGTVFEALIEVCAPMMLDKETDEVSMKIKNESLEEIEESIIQDFNEGENLKFKLLNKEGEIINSISTKAENMKSFVLESKMSEDGFYLLSIESKSKKILKKILFRL